MKVRAPQKNTPEPVTAGPNVTRPIKRRPTMKAPRPFTRAKKPRTATPIGGGLIATYLQRPTDGSDSSVAFRCMQSMVRTHPNPTCGGPHPPHPPPRGAHPPPPIGPEQTAEPQDRPGHDQGDRHDQAADLGLDQVDGTDQGQQAADQRLPTDPTPAYGADERDEQEGDTEAERPEPVPAEAGIVEGARDGEGGDDRTCVERARAARDGPSDEEGDPDREHQHGADGLRLRVELLE